MIKAQTGSVQRLARKRHHRLRHIGWQNLGPHLAFAAIGWIAHQPMARIGHMHPNLMRAPGFQPTFQQRQYPRRAIGLQNPRPRNRVPPTMPQNRLTLAVGFVASQLGRNAQNIARLKIDPLQATQARITGLRHPMRQRQITPCDSMGGELFGQAMMRPIRFRHHQQT